MTEIEWSEAGNPIAWCPFCQMTHEWTVRASETPNGSGQVTTEWRCADAEGVQVAIDGLVAEAYERVRYGA